MLINNIIMLIIVGAVTKRFAFCAPCPQFDGTHGKIFVGMANTSTIIWHICLFTNKEYYMIFPKTF